MKLFLQVKLIFFGCKVITVTLPYGIDEIRTTKEYFDAYLELMGKMEEEKKTTM